MDESDDNMSAEDVNSEDGQAVKVKPKKRSLVERELETSLTARVTSPATNVDASSTSRYGRARRMKSDLDETEKAKQMKSPFERTPAKSQSPVYRMYASNSPIKTEPKETPQKVTVDSLENQIENIYHENISLSRFGSDEKKIKSPGGKLPKIYIRKDLIQQREKDEDNISLIKNMFSPSPHKSNSHLSNILERSSEKYMNTKPQNGYINTSSVVKTLDFDGNKKKKENKDIKSGLSKSDLFDVEANCKYQVGDLAWARMGTYPYWACIITREPSTNLFVKKKMFGRIERDVIHVTFFGDNGRRGWIVDTMLRKYLGILEFEATRERFSPAAKKKDPKLYAAFFVSEKKMPQWTISVEEAESLFKEPKRLRIDLLNDMLANYRVPKSASKSQKSSKITRTASDVSLSESLYDTLFSEDDGKSADPEKSITKTRKSLDVCDVVTACLDNMAAISGITKIQKQSHMDRWLQKAKSKTPEKLQSIVTPQKKEKEIKVISSKKKKILTSKVPIQKPYSFRKSVYESQNLKPHHDEHDYTSKSHSTPQKNSAGFEISVIATIESLSGEEMEDEHVKTDDIVTTGTETRNNTAGNEHAISEISPIVSVNDTVDEIQVNICSVEENAELESCLQSDVTLSTKIHVQKSTVSKDELGKVLESMDNDSEGHVQKHKDSDRLQQNTIASVKPVVPPDSEKDITMDAEIMKVSDNRTPQQGLDESPSKKVRLLRYTRRTQINSEFQRSALEESPKVVKTKTIESLRFDSDKPGVLIQDKNTQKSAVKPIVIKKISLRRPIKNTPFAEIFSRGNQTESVTQKTETVVKKDIETLEGDVKTSTEPSQNDLDKVVENTVQHKNAEKSPDKPLVPMKLRLKRQSKIPQIATEETRNCQSEPKKTIKQVDSQTILNSHNDSIKSSKQEAAIIDNLNFQKSPTPTTAIKQLSKRQNKNAQMTMEIDLKVNTIELNLPHEPLLLVKGTEETDLIKSDLTENKEIPTDKLVNTDVFEDEGMKNYSQLPIPKPSKLRLKRKSKNRPFVDDGKTGDDQITSTRNESFKSVKGSANETISMESGNLTQNTQVSSKSECVDQTIKPVGSLTVPDNLVNGEDFLETDNSISNPEKPKSNTRLRLKRHTRNPYDLWANVEAKNNKKPLHHSGESPKENRSIKSIKQTKKVLKDKIETDEVDPIIPIPVTVPVVKNTEVVLEDYNMPKIFDKQIPNMNRFQRPIKGDDQTDYDEQMKSLQMALDESQKELCILLESDAPIESTSLMEEMMDIDEVPTKKLTRSKKVDFNSFVNDPGTILEDQNTQEKIENQTPNKKRLTRLSKSPRVALEPRKKESKKKSKRPVLNDSQSEACVELSMENTDVMKEIAEPMRMDEKPTENLQINSVTPLEKLESKTEENLNNKPANSKNIRLRRNLKSPKIVPPLSTKGKKSVIMKQNKSAQVILEENKKKSKEDDLGDSLEQDKVITENKEIEKSKLSVEKEIEETTDLIEQNDKVNVALPPNLEKEVEKKIKQNEVVSVAPLPNLEKEVEETTDLVEQNDVMNIVPLHNFEKEVEETTDLVEQNDVVNVIPLPNLEKDLHNLNLIEENKVAEVLPPKEIENSDLPEQNYVPKIVQLANVEKESEQAMPLTEQRNVAEVVLLPSTRAVDMTYLLEKNDVVEITPQRNVEKETERPTHLIDENIVMDVTESASTPCLIDTTQSERIENEASFSYELIENTQNAREEEIDIVLDEQIKNKSGNSESLFTANNTREEDIEYGHLEFTDKHSPQKVFLNPTGSIQTHHDESTTTQTNYVQDLDTEEKEYDHLDFIFSSCSASLLDQSTDYLKADAIKHHSRIEDGPVVKKTMNTSEPLANTESIRNLEANKSNIDHTYVLPTIEKVLVKENKKAKIEQRELRVNVEKLPLSSLPISLLSKINYKGKAVKENRSEKESDNSKEILKDISKNVVEKNTKTGVENIKMNGDICNDVCKIEEEELLLRDGFEETSKVAKPLQIHETDAEVYVNNLKSNKAMYDSLCDGNLVSKNETDYEKKMSEIDVASKLVDCVINSETISEISNQGIVTIRDHIKIRDNAIKLCDMTSIVDVPDDVNTESEQVADDKIAIDETKSLNRTINSKAPNTESKSLTEATKDQVVATVETISQNITDKIDDPANDETLLLDEAVKSDVAVTTLQNVTTTNNCEITVDTKTHDIRTNGEVFSTFDTTLRKTKIQYVTAKDVDITNEPVEEGTSKQNLAANETVMNVDEFVRSVNRLPEPVKLNGFHMDECIDFSDEEFSAETSSINSEDSCEPLSITKLKLVVKNRSIARRALSDPDFAMYLEMRQDEVMDEHPELSQPEIVEYLYKTWQYEENAKSDVVKNDEIEQSTLVKGLNDDLRQKSIRNNFRESKKRKKRIEDKKHDEDTLSVTSFNSDVSDASVKKRLRTRTAKSPALSIENNEDNFDKEIKLEIKTELMDNISINSNVSFNSMKFTSPFDKETSVTSTLEDKAVVASNETDVESSSSIEMKHKSKSKFLDKGKKKSPKSKDVSLKRYFKVENQTEPKVNNEQNAEIKIKEEYDPDTASINSEDSEVSLSKRKSRKEKTNKTTTDPEFLKYVELRQDDLIDENPQLTQEEIVGYLYKTWLYEESVKSDIKKTDDFEQARLVKGLDQGSRTPQSKKIKKKVKIEKDYNVDEVIQKDKPKRKVSQHYYNEDLSDIEDEIKLFEIFKPKNELGMLTGDQIRSEGLEIDLDEIDEVELYFSQLTQPKPNVFKGYVREKVCDICERTGNLVKCKGCNNMFHAECVQKETEVVEVPPPPKRGRKKKIKPLVKKPDDSESQSDDKSQDVSIELNASTEEAPRTVNAEDFEALLAAKMQELIPTVDLTYDSYSSDEGLDWNDIGPGKCEIVDVKLKPKIVTDYTNFKCNNCQAHNTPICFVCKAAVSKTGVNHRQKCQTAHCNKYYHVECLDHWPQTHFHSGEPSKTNKKVNETVEYVTCPRHVCHTCVSDDPRGCRTRFIGDKLARCVRCPATYHTFTKCLPAGTQILSGSQIVCPRHYENRPGKVSCHVNTGWCFICALGGSLICCEYCPTSFHAECLNIDPPEGGYMCEDCETGRLPLYGEMVWVKLGHYRWWPGIVLHPVEIPDNIMAVKHSQGEFVVRFFGQYDHYWVNRGRVFPFQEGDSGRISSQKSKIDADFTTAMEHAQRAFEILKSAVPNEEESLDIASSLLPPHYVKLRVNKPCGSLCGRRVDAEESSLTQCECNPDEDDPCGPYTHCINRMLLTECGPHCRSGERCSNRAFEKRLYPKMAPYRTPHRGWGLRALEDIKAGQFVIEYVGELIDEEEFRRRMNRKHEIRDENFYFLTLDKERMIDAGPKGNMARFMNHCCEPNCETQKWTVLGDVRVGLFALYDIPANSELTFNYNLECAGIEKKKCMCGARRCSGYIGAKPKQDDSQSKKATKRAYKKRKNADESPSTSKDKPKRPVGRPRKSQETAKVETKPRELTEIEKDLLIIKNATNGISSDSEGSSRLSSIDCEHPKALKRKRVSFSTEEDSNSKKSKMEEKGVEVGD